MRFLLVTVSLAALATGSLYLHPTAGLDSAPSAASSADAARATPLLNRQRGFFVPNLGQWDHPARYVHWSGPMTLFLEDRGWVVEFVERSVKPKPRPHRPAHHAMPSDSDENRKIRGAAFAMTFEGDGHVPEIVGENKFPGHHNYFLSSDESRWRTDVPLYGSVRYKDLYPGIDLRLRERRGVPEYDLLLQPGADLVAVSVHVEGGQGLSIANDGSLVMETALGPVIQTVPRTWQVDRDGRKREVACSFAILGAERFGFSAPGWDGESRLTIDPGLVWSTYVGRSQGPAALSVDASGVVTWAGANSEVSRLDPSRSGSAQLVYSTFLGGNSISHQITDLFVDASGVVTVAGVTNSANFPVTSGAYDTTYNGGSINWYGGDVFISRLDPCKTGSAQVVYSTFLGGSNDDAANALSVDASGVVTVTGRTHSTNFPTTNGAYNTAHNGPSGNQPFDAFISRLDPRKSGSAQLVYSTFIGGSHCDNGIELSVDASGVVTVAGLTCSSNFPTTSDAYDTTFSNGDTFISRLDPSKFGSAQLVYSTFLGGSVLDYAAGLSVDARGLVTVGGFTTSHDFPTTSGAYSSTQSGFDAFVSRLDPSKSGSAQLVYSTFLGGCCQDRLFAISVDASGVVTAAGETMSADFPTTSGAYSTNMSGGFDAFVSRLDPSKSGSAQLVYSTFLGGSLYDGASALYVDVSGVVTVGGGTLSTDFPTTSGAYSTVKTGGGFVSRLSMGVAFYADRYELSLNQAGTQNLNLDAGKQHAGKSYAIFGSMTGTGPGVSLLGLHIPLNYDSYTHFTIGSAVAPMFVRFKGTLDSKGEATASINLPSGLATLLGFTLYHAYIVVGNGGTFDMASNAVPLALVLPAVR